jgi:hypothetical protein
MHYKANADGINERKGTTSKLHEGLAPVDTPYDEYFIEKNSDDRRGRRKEVIQVRSRHGLWYP